MSHRFADLMFTENVKAAQKYYGSRAHNERLQSNFGPNDKLTSRETEFIALRDTFYLATVGESGWPYVQHRGGPPGFLRTLGSNLLAYADFRGNTQLVSVGNSLGNDRCALILMDYPNRRRLKLLGRLRVEDSRSVPAHDLTKVELPNYNARIERIAYIEVEAFDWNCPQHITRRYTELEFTEQQAGQSRTRQDKNRVLTQ